MTHEILIHIVFTINLCLNHFEHNPRCIGFHKLGSVVECDMWNTHSCYIHRWEHHNHYELSLNRFGLNHHRIFFHHFLFVLYSSSIVDLNHYDLHGRRIVYHKLVSSVERDTWNAHPCHIHY